jgi:ATPase subunit of ABC transporter with duplicated ATPase domains
MCVQSSSEDEVGFSAAAPPVKVPRHTMETATAQAPADEGQSLEEEITDLKARVTALEAWQLEQKIAKIRAEISAVEKRRKELKSFKGLVDSTKKAIRECFMDDPQLDFEAMRAAWQHNI